MQVVFESPFDYGNTALNVAEFKELYFSGIPMNNITDNTIQFYIDSATRELEGYLNIKVLKEVIKESKDFDISDFLQWGYIRTSFPVRAPIGLVGMYNNQTQITYPKDWLVVQDTSANGVMPKNIHIMPSAGNPSITYFLTTLVPYWTGSLRKIPNFWHLEYETGFDVIPTEIVNIIGKMASLNVFYLLGDLVTGTAGVNNKTISIDGLSQTYSAGKGGYSDRIDNYIAELKEGLPKTRLEYSGVEFSVI